MAGLIYLDASAIVKLVVEGLESPALRDALRDRPRRVSSALALVEVHLAAARRLPAPPTGRAGTILAGLALIPIDQPTLEAAGGLGEHGVRALDAIHLATARSLGKGLESFIAYDQRLLAAAKASGLPPSTLADGNFAAISRERAFPDVSSGLARGSAGYGVRPPPPRPGRASAASRRARSRR